MASTFKTLLSGDVKTVKSLLHEVIPVTGTILSGTYSGSNVKTYSHGKFETVYDYPFLSSSANRLFDLSVGYSPNSVLSSSTATDNDDKINIYNTFAQVLMGHDVTGSIQEFDEDGDITGGGTKIQEAVFINFTRLLIKDEIKKGSFNLSLYPSGTVSFLSASAAVTDTNAGDDFRANSPAGEYGILYSGTVPVKVGLLFYQAGVAVLTASLFPDEFGTEDVSYLNNAAATGVQHALVSGSITGSSDGLLQRVNNVTFNNTTELNSRIYFCRANNNEFNYSANPTYTSGSKIEVKNVERDEPISYITTVGLYSPDNELLAVAKLSEPLKKTPSNEITLRVRTDY